ncbi:MAG: hypothetical protein UW43_C0002G0018 [Candidatus Yanofskybacteria bacterium GW2011_GWA1_44_21]|uniref:Capsular polysaccharide assembling protein CapF C-terminal domain-containing protein n=2 Tax=Parcubacteria group TaxID=1794811 RepID=A0A1F8H0A8_9BACT|nr:MAG: hypothetical protein UU38_C0004G0070 [Candidatus Wolfebacteria bacterium GW2011_GWB1_41_12]KKT28350.1 MAG: hypothetical protein UW14_C0009G0002 [Candidatus Yanofskybacteria bacterium GW2011_GWA2_44_10]KKT50734.1 MAG: hypothetical protein UW43_C0002G0018 [Candidatus Yanofskybacteria bacterium GW2011_GWA1_44_21]OGN03498.1 MAG: hypothetical protein A2657_02335 [Candidatus Yanofskybacteria bacterium RIFCSPHIGHO2_01_FULL_44_110b]OGN14188.1 MAG: hypothetical protein A3C01_01160 [Candidatus Ya
MEKAFIKTKPCKKIETFDADKKPNGWVLEIVSDKDNFTKHIRGQIYLTVVEPGLFKGYHVHAAADLFITCLDGQVASIIYKNKNTKREIPMGGDNFKTVFVPKGYLHGIKNIGKSQAKVLVYRYPAWMPALEEQLFVSSKNVGNGETWIKIKKFLKEFNEKK